MIKKDPKNQSVKASKSKSEQIDEHDEESSIPTPIEASRS